MTILERSKTFYHHHNCVVIHKSTNMDSHTVAHYRIGVCTWPVLRGAKHSNSISYLLYAWAVGYRPTLHIHFFTTQKQYWWDAIIETIHQQLLQLVSIRKNEDLQKASDNLNEWKSEKVRWRYASHKKSIQIVLSRASKVLTQWPTSCGRTLTFLGMQGRIQGGRLGRSPPSNLRK